MNPGLYAIGKLFHHVNNYSMLWSSELLHYLIWHGHTKISGGKHYLNFWVKRSLEEEDVMFNLWVKSSLEEKDVVFPRNGGNYLHDYMVS
jgi:hypothetical protein